MKKILNLKTAATLIGAYAGAAVFFYFFDIQFTRENLLIYGVLMFGIYLCIKEMTEIKNPLIYALAGVYAVALSGSFVFGRSLYSDWGIERTDLFKWLALGMAIFCVITNIMRFVLCHTRQIHLEEKESKINWKTWLIRMIIIFICWLPYFLTFYPGCGSADSYSSVMQALGDQPLNNHHPVMFTLFVKICLKVGTVFGGLKEGIAVFSIAQMLIMASVLSVCSAWMEKHGVSSKWGWVSTVFWAINPVIATYSITMWKDVLFSAWILLLVMFLYDAVKGGAEYLCKWKNLTKLTCLCFLVAFGRNNGIYIVVIVLLAIGLMYRKWWKRLLPLSLAVLILITLIQGPGYAAFGIKKSGFAESVAIPLQQIGHTVATDGKITKEQEEFINQLLPVETIKEVYNPYTADAIKFDKNFNGSYLNNNQKEFLKTWVQMLPHNLKGYIEAYGMQTMGYWYLDIANWKCTFGLEYADKYGLETANIVEDITGIDSSKLIQDAVATNDILPVISYLFKVAAPVWIILFLCCIMIWQKRIKYVLCLLPLIGTWGTLMIATPVYCEFRYMFSLHLALPILAAFLFYSPELGTIQSLMSIDVEEAESNVWMSRNKFVYRAVVVAAAFALALISCRYALVTMDSKATLLILFFTFVYDVMLRKIIPQHKMLIGACAVLGLLWGTAVTIGRKIDIVNKVFICNFSVLDIIWALLFGILAFVVFNVLLENILRYIEKNSFEYNDLPVFRRKNWIIMALLMFLLWCPYFLTYFPGNLSSDSYSSIAQSIGGELWNNHHPVMFTVFVKVCLTIGNLFGGLETGICIFTIVQMIILSLTLSYCVEWMRVKYIPIEVRSASFVFLDLVHLLQCILVLCGKIFYFPAGVYCWQ